MTNTLGVWSHSRLLRLFHPRYSIVARLGYAIGGVTLLFAVLESAVFLPLAQARLEKLSGQRMQELAMQMSDRLDRGMFARYRDIQILSSLDSIRDPTTPLSRQQVLLETLQQTYPAYTWIGLTDTDGRVVASTGKLLHGTDLSASPWFQHALRGPYVSDVQQSARLSPQLTNDPNDPLRFVTITMPIRTAQGQIRGLVVAYLSWSWAQDIQDTFLSSMQGYDIDLLVINQAGTIILGPFAWAVPTLLPAQVATPPIEQTGYHQEIWNDGQGYLTGFARTRGYQAFSGLGWTVLARQPTSIDLAPAQQLARLMLLWSVVSTMVCGLIGLVLVRRIVKPLGTIADAADSIIQGRTNRSLPVVKGQDEVARLSQSLTTLVTNLTAQEAMLQQQNCQLQHELGERRKAETALRESEEQFRLLVEGVRDYAIVKLDPEGRISTWNSGAEAITGYPAAAILGQSLERLYLADHVAAGLPLLALQRVQQVGRYEDESWYQHANGTRFLAWIVITKLVADTGALGGYALVMRDITQRKRLEDQVIRAQKMDSIGQLAGGIAHDFNNLLTAISGYADLIRDTAPADTPFYEDAREIQHVAERGAALTRQLLTFARQQTLTPQTINLNDLVRNIEKLLRRLLPSNIELRFHIAPDACPIKADAGQIEQVVVNLAINARDAMANGGTLTIETTSLSLDPLAGRGLLDLPGGSYVLLSVNDTGSGIPLAVRDRIFEPFFTTKEPGKGTGLGLATCYGIVKQHGGTIWLYSEVDHGTIVKVYLPQIDESAPERQLPSQSTPHTGDETVLVVDDDRSIRAMVVRVLRSCGYTVLEATNGAEALALVQVQRPASLDLLLTDLMMPHVGGVAAAAQITEYYPGLKVLFMSGYTQLHTPHEQQRELAGAVIEKPFTSAILAQKVRDVLDA